ncbi:carbohydrate kinase [Ilumatobacter sp.]|uniref:carbohydrate kinase family protein n=1 Tax=Ilumatobacter sp. TaxID=1967498 RepID=UPI0037502CAA
MIISCGEALVDIVDGTPLPGGGPMNAAIACARLGVPAAFAGALSTDEHGEMLHQHISTNGVSLDLVQRTDAPTARAVVEHVPELRFTFEGNNTADMQLSEFDVAAAGPGPHILHGGTLGMFRGRTAETLAAFAELHDGVVSLDPNIRPQILDANPVLRTEWNGFHDRWVSNTDIYKGSDEDLAWIFPDLDPSEWVETLLAAGVSAVILTRGADGLSVFTADGEARAVSRRLEVVDTVGAGDTICGVVLASLWESGTTSKAAVRAMTLGDWTEIAEHAVEAAALTCSRAGADVPYRHELTW